LASCLFGTVSGSVVANVMVDGVFTIPLMKKTGYKPEVAAAIEAVASTGGQIMPPVMGIAAFLMADFLAIPYAKVAIAALIPALIYYFVLFLQIDLEAGKMGLKGTYDSSFRMWPVVKRSWIFFLPLAILIYFLFIVDLEPGRSALFGAAAVFILSFLTKETRMGLRKLLISLERTGKNLLMIGVATALAGIIIGGVFVTGLGTTFSFTLLRIGGENLFLILLITGVACFILGTSMATASIYIILAVLVAPGLVQLGVLPLAAHLFIFYMGLTAFITPPVCFAAYAAAAIAGTDPMKTGLVASRFGVGAYFVAFIFVYSPALILEGAVLDILQVLVQTIAGLSFFSVALTGFLFYKIRNITRILLAIGSVSLLVPASMQMGPIEPRLLNVVGFALCFLILLSEYWKYRKERVRRV
jgi:TRAP transporter 4TM/12TM fusion protein